MAVVDDDEAAALAASKSGRGVAIFRRVFFDDRRFFQIRDGFAMELCILVQRRR